MSLFRRQNTESNNARAVGNRDMDPILRRDIAAFIDAHFADADAASSDLAVESVFYGSAIAYSAQAACDSDGPDGVCANAESTMLLRDDGGFSSEESLSSHTFGPIGTDDDDSYEEPLDHSWPSKPLAGAAPAAASAPAHAAAAAPAASPPVAPTAGIPASAPDDHAPSAGAHSLRPSKLGSARHEDDLRSWLDRIDDPFSTTLLQLIDERGLSDSEVYKRAQMSRQLFSRIRSDASYRPAKKTVLALAVALELSSDDARDLLQRAGFALSRANKRDVIVEYFLEHKTYDLFAINEALYEFDQPLL